MCVVACACVHSVCVLCVCVCVYIGVPRLENIVWSKTARAGVRGASTGSQLDFPVNLESSSVARAHAAKHTHTHAPTHARLHARTHTQAQATHAGVHTATAHAHDETHTTQTDTIRCSTNAHVVCSGHVFAPHTMCIRCGKHTEAACVSAGRNFHTCLPVLRGHPRAGR